jgi:hypothetical protein
VNGLLLARLEVTMACLIGIDSHPLAAVHQWRTMAG